MRRLLMLLVAALAAAPAMPAQVIQTPRVNYAHLADLVVNRTWKLAKGERVVFFWDKAHDRGMADALRAAIKKAGGIVEEIAAPTPASVKDLSKEARAARDSAWAEVFDRSQAAIWLPTSLEALGDKPFERLVEKSTVRSVHFHWFIPPTAGDLARVEEMYARAIDIPPELLRWRIDAVEHAVRGATVHITAPNGTDITLEIPKGAWVHRNTGEATRAKVRDAKSVRDREEELPASVFRTTDIRNLRGNIVGYSSFDTRSPMLKVMFIDGKVAKFEGLQGAGGLVKAWEEATGDKTLPGELVIGTNPALPNVLPSGFMPYYGYGSGVVRFAIGDNWESGGPNRSSNGEVLLFIPNATVVANGVTVVKNGVLQVGR